MRLEAFGDGIPDVYKDFTIDDVGRFQIMVNRMIEDVELITYVVVRYQRETGGSSEQQIDEPQVINAIAIVDPEAASALKGGEGSLQAVTHPEMVRDFAKAPVPHTDAGIQMISRYVNFRLINLLRRAAETAGQQGVKTIGIIHLAPWCHGLPYPANLLSC
jgi:hypothetical protein